MPLDSHHNCNNLNTSQPHSKFSSPSTTHSTFTQHDSLDTSPLGSTHLEQQDAPSFSHSTEGKREHCPIHGLPVDLITHIFARLDPTSLITAAKVCRRWRKIITDDSCWRAAFASYFGRLPFRRLKPNSWKEEYTHRSHLLRMWEKGRGTILSISPDVGHIDAAYMDFENSSIVAGSTQRGVAAKCNISTGKRDKHLFYSTDEGVFPALDAIKIDRGRILWGFNQGFITMTIRSKSVVGRQLKVFSDAGLDRVCALALPCFTQDVVLSGHHDGLIKIWDVSTATCARNLKTIATGPACIEAVDENRILVGYLNGTIAVFEVNIVNIASTHRERRRNGVSTQLRAEPTISHRLIPAPSHGKPVQSIIYDKQTGTLMASYEDSAHVRKFDASTGECLSVFGVGFNVGMISCMVWDVDKMNDALPEYTLKSHRKKTNGQQSSATASSSTGSRDNAEQAPYKATRLLVTGDTEGTITVWDSDAVGDDVNPMEPLWRYSADESPVSALYLDACKLVSGYDNGWVRIWDPLRGINLKTIANKLPKQASRFHIPTHMTQVRHIWCNEYGGVATVGHDIKTWNYSGKTLLARHQLRPKGKAPVVSRQKAQYEIKREVEASQDALHHEKKEWEKEAKRLDKLTLGGLSDEEMLAYAMMLSQDEQTSSSSANHQEASVSLEASDFVDDSEDMMQAVIASLSVESDKEGTPPTASVDQQRPDTTIDEWPAILGIDSNSRESPSTLDRTWDDSKKARTMSPSSSNTTAGQPPVDMEDDDDDMELQYVLKLSLDEQ